MLDILPAENATAKAIPKGLYRSAQGCAPSTTLGAGSQGPFTLKGLDRGPLHTTMCGIDRREGNKRYNPLRVDPPTPLPPRVALGAQPWAE
jgi:hypothetical protein